MTEERIESLMKMAKQGSTFTFNTATATITVYPINFFHNHPELMPQYHAFDLKDVTGKKIETVDRTRLRFIFENS